MTMCKPKSVEELETLLALARRCISRGRHFFGPHVDTLVAEFMDLNIGDSSEIWALLAELLKEISAKNYFNTVAGGSGSLFTYEVFSFLWYSKKLKNSVLLSFSIKNEIFYYFSLQKKS